MNVPVDRSTDDLLAAIGCRLSKLRRVEHRIDLSLVRSCLVVSALWHSPERCPICSEVLLLTHLDLLLSLVSLSHLDLLHLVSSHAIGDLLAVLRLTWVLLLAVGPLVLITVASSHTVATLMASIGVVRSGAIVVVAATWVLMTDDPVQRHSSSRSDIGSISIVLLWPVALTHRTSTAHHATNPVATSLLIHLVTTLQLVHEETEGGDQLDQVRVLRAHDVHLVLLIGFLVDLLFEVQAAGLLGLDEGDEEVPPLEENLRGCLLGRSGRLTISEAHESHASICEDLGVVHVAELGEEVRQLLLGRRRVHILDDQVHVHHGLLPLVGLLGDLLLALVFRLELADVDATLDLV